MGKKAHRERLQSDCAAGVDSVATCVHLKCAYVMLNIVNIVCLGMPTERHTPSLTST